MKAAVDIGSNTVLLLIGCAENGKVTVADEKQEAPRLGRDVDEEKNLSPASVRRVIHILKSYKKYLSEKYPKVNEVRLIATSAVRDANNRTYFIDKIRQETGFEVQTISGQEEARLTFLGAKSVIDDIDGEIAVIDIGGGSTEVAFGKKRILNDRHSFNMGSVRFTERYLKGDPPQQTEIQACHAAVCEALANRPFKWTKLPAMVGVSGTVTSLAAIEAGHDSYRPGALNGMRLARSVVTKKISDFSALTCNELLDLYPTILDGRNDVFLAGLIILEEFMKKYDIPVIYVSTGGIRHGALLA